MPAEEDMATVRRFVEEVINRGNLELTDELVNSDHVNHDPTAPETGEGPEGIKELIGTYRSAFPDLRFEIGEMFASGDGRVAHRWIMTGTHEGEMMGVAPTKNKVVFHGFVVQEWGNDGKIKNEWHFGDPGAMFAQMKPETKIPFRQVLAPIAAEPVIAANDDKEKANLAAAKAMNDAYGKGDLAGVTAAAADDMVMHDVPMPEDTVGKDKNAAMLKEGFGAFTENKSTSVVDFAAGDYVISVSTWEGKMTGDMPSMGIKATNKPVKIAQATITRWEGGKMKEIWAFYNGTAMMQQLGLMPPPDAAKPGK